VFETYAVAALGVAALAGGWLAVQLAFRRSFPTGDDGDPDPLAGRGCMGCTNAGHCGDACSGGGERR
jgi:hypothetical protein